MDFYKIMAMEKQCKDCPYLINDDDNIWVCDLKPNTKCINQFLICKEAEATKGE